MKFETLFKYSSDFYAKLEKVSKVENVKGVDVRVYRGHVSIAYRDLGYSYTYYGPIRRALERTGCFSVLQRGSSHQDSVIVLHHSPDLATWQATNEDLTAPIEDAMLRQQLEDLKQSLGGLNVAKVLTVQESRLDDLTGRVEQLEGKIENGKAEN
jgi:hypothetical protein